MLPMSDPRKEEGESWQPIDGGGGKEPVQVQVSASDIQGQVTLNVVYEAGSELITMYNKMKQATATLYGHLNTNGPGSTGKSSPDGAAPSRPSTGASGSW